MVAGTTWYHESSGYNYTNSVWERDAKGWRKAPNSSLPITVGQGAMAYDSARGKTVYFGGVDGREGQTSGRTFEWDGNEWVERLGGRSPKPRYRASMVYDEARGVCVLFGGMLNVYGDAYGDTWEFDGTNWRQVSSGGPVPRISAAMVYDPIGKRTLLHGGITAEGKVLSDTWSWNGVSWSAIPTSNRGPALFEHSGVFDPVRNELILTFGSIRHYRPSPAVWALRGGTWRPLPSGNIAPRFAHAALYHAGINKTVLFGGSAASRRLSDLWFWNGSSWENDDPAPPAYAHASMAFDEARDHFVCFGGRKNHASFDPETPSDQTWIFDGEWRQVSPINNPPPMEFSKMVYDQNSQEILLIGVNDSASFQRTFEMWAWNGSDWRELDPGLNAPKSSLMAWYDQGQESVVMIGKSYAWLPNTIWYWTGSAWVDTRLVCPLYGESVIYDNTRNVALLREYQSRQTWLWGGGKWQLAFAEPGDYRWGAALIFDYRAGKALRYGGAIAISGSHGDGATWDGQAWQPLGMQGPGSRSSGSFASTPSGPGLIFGGWSHAYGGIYSEYYDDTWSVEWRE
jgi:hypothetical protein